MDVEERPETVTEADFVVDAGLEDPAICPVRLNKDGDGYAVTVDLKAVNLERRRHAMASGAFGERYRIRAGIAGHGLGAQTKTRPGRPARARALARGVGRLPESAGLQCQENGAGAYAQTRRHMSGDGVKKGDRGPLRSAKRPLNRPQTPDWGRRAHSPATAAPSHCIPDRFIVLKT